MSIERCMPGKDPPLINFPPEAPGSTSPPAAPLSGFSIPVNGQSIHGGGASLIPFVDAHGERYARAARRATASGWVMNGPEVMSFETEFAAAVGARSGVAVSSGATALEIALESLGLPWRSPVLVSALGSIGLAQAIVQAGHYPVLVDVSPVTGMPTPD